MRMLEIERELPVQPATAFAAFTDPDPLARWWGPEGFTIPSLDFDAHPGRACRIEMQPPEGSPFHLTSVALGQRSFATEARLALHRDGWTESFDKLARLLRPG